MAIITPSTGPANCSLSSPLLTPGYPLVSVEHANPHEHGLGKNDGVSPETKRANAVHSSGHDNDRVA